MSMRSDNTPLTMRPNEPYFGGLFDHRSPATRWLHRQQRYRSHHAFELSESMRTGRMAAAMRHQRRLTEIDTEVDRIVENAPASAWFERNLPARPPETYHLLWRDGPLNEIEVDPFNGHYYDFVGLAFGSIIPLMIIAIIALILAHIYFDQIVALFG